MQIIRNIEYVSDTREENLPQYEEDFPYICTQARLSEYQQKAVPWHWHAAIELFYVPSGAVEYITPERTVVFPAGTAGMVNSNILHMTKVADCAEETIQNLHIFDASLIAGISGNRITKKYITPILACPGLEIVSVFPETEEKREIIEQIRRSFEITEDTDGYEMRIRNALSEIWLALIRTINFEKYDNGQKVHSREGLKAMMVYIHEHYGEKVTVSQIAEAGFLSVRECYRVFHDGLHSTPVEYLLNYRLQMACHFLTNTNNSMTAIAHACGFSSSSHFSKIFQQKCGTSPTQYRQGMARK